MSDLDADLYGDLYGNDETDFAAEQIGEELALDTTASEPATETSTPAPTTSTDLRQNGSSASETNGSSYSIQTVTPTPVQSVTSAIPTYSSTATQPQKIPTYEQPLPTSAPLSRPDSALQKIPVNERSIRPSEMKDEGKMFIGGLNWDTTDDGLRDYFTQFGKVDACTIMRDAAGRSRCFAFLTFDDPASVNAVMVREHILDGKIIDPKRAIPRQEHQRATKLFIGGLPGSVTSESMREFFSQFGKVIDSTVMLDRETGRSKGFGFVSFEDTDVRPFLGFGNLEIDGKLIDVKLAQPRYQRDNLQEDQQDGASFSGASSGGTYNARSSGGAFNSTSTTGATGATGAAAGVTTGFDPQALAALYTRMIQMNAGMNPAMMGGMGGMNPMMGGAGMRPGMGMGMGMGGMGMAMGNPAMGMGMGRGTGMMGAGGAAGGAGGAGMGGNIPRGPRGAGTPGQAGGAGMTNAGVGPQRNQRGGHNFHPYAR
ncbi:RNA-binding domain-containing protein [Coprinellus micaceus]|uniref:RNA-binding domain-containing protein n=1 Tax=Coprinellus micaceus TaxID=71717 RepID=A0A4Y7T471_COPMI|nr:RNA-binding domain-containing protein [Coprinellus micaceus]